MFEQFKKNWPRFAEDIEKYCEANNLELPHDSRTAFEYFLGWHGILGYTDLLIKVLDGLRACE